MAFQNAFNDILFEVADRIATVTLHRPDKLNAFTVRMMYELIEAFDETDADDAVRAVIVTGAGRAFCAGADVSGGAQTFDYESQGFPLNNLFYPVMHKRVSFAHEQEIRLVKTLSEYWGLPERTGPPGIEIPWAVESVVDSIYVNPYAPDYYQAVVTSVVRRVLPILEDRVKWSQMRGAPVY